MGDHHHGLVVLDGEVGKELAHHLNPVGVEGGRWLIGLDNLRVSVKGPGDGHPLVLPPGQFARVLVDQFFDPKVF